MDINANYKKAFEDLEKYILSKDKHYQGGLKEAIKTIKLINDIPEDKKSKDK
jgi:hypothetical protein